MTMTLRILTALVLTFLSLPAQPWQKATAESVGFSTPRLEALTPFLKTLDTTSMMVISHGKVVYEYGDVKKISYLASCRKSILAMLYGNYVASGQIVLTKTLRDLKFDDVGGLLPRELEATVENLITARSGVYHPPSYLGDAQDSAPPRGSQKPGTYYLYNNWDFNAAGAAFEKMTGKDIYDALQSDLAVPLGMEDFDRSLQKKEGDAKKSIIPAYPIHLSTRDMARIGQLMLREGNWHGKQVIPRDWAKHIRVARHARVRHESAVVERVRAGQLVGLRLHVVGVGRSAPRRAVRRRVHSSGRHRTVHHRFAGAGLGGRAQDCAGGERRASSKRVGHGVPGDPDARRHRALW